MSSFKPRHTEAIARMRTNGAGLVAAVISSTLLPLPSPWTAFRVVWSSTSGGISRNVGIVWYALCAAELFVFAVFAFNALQAALTLKYAKNSLRPPPSSTKPKTVVSTPSLSSSQRRLSGISTISPQTQKSFSSSTSMSTIYASSPLSTPSRTLQYTTPLDLSTSSSTGSPSPILNSPLAAYRGRHRTGAGRAFDGEMMNRLTQSLVDNTFDGDDDDDE